VRLLLGELEPIDGRIRLGVGLEVVYLDQMRSALDPSKTVAENVSDGSAVVRSGGGTRHINAYLQDFLFDSDDAQKPVSILSGGERNRLLLAKLFSRPSNLLVLDEPTNDLDVDTLEVLEDRLLAYDGTILLVSHDRELLDNVVTDCLVLPGDGRVIEYAGGYSDWRERAIAWSREDSKPRAGRGDAGNRGTAASDRAAPGSRSRDGDTRRDRRRDRPRKLTFKEARELEALPERISGLEARQQAIHERLSDPDLYRSNAELVRELTAELSEVEESLAGAYARWEELDAVAEGST
jgi:ATP-binding cassette subfamily F protein uup